ncbi:hypothetical protein M5G07_11085 [Serratia symbiotica]|nr:hypothetical protein [Serratia symbiotica]
MSGFVWCSGQRRSFLRIIFPQRRKMLADVQHVLLRLLVFLIFFEPVLQSCGIRLHGRDVLNFSVPVCSLLQRGNSRVYSS